MANGQRAAKIIGAANEGMADAATKSQLASSFDSSPLGIVLASLSLAATIAACFI